MSQSDFNIIVGVKLDEAEKSIRSMIDEIGESYPLKLKAVISNKDEFSKEIKGIVGILGNLDNLKLNINNNELKNAEKSAEKIGSKLTDGMSNASREAKQMSKNMEEALSYFNLLKKTERDNKVNRVKTVTEVTGNDFASTSTKRTDSGKVLDVVVTEDYKKLEKYIANVNKEVERLSKNGHVAKEEIEDLSHEIVKLNSFKITGLHDNDFDSTLSKVQDKLIILSEKDNDLARQKQELERQIAQEKKVWSKQFEVLNKKEYTHYKQMESLKNKISKLDVDQIKDASQLEKQLKLINEQYEKAVAFQEKTALKASAVDKAKAQKKKVKNLNEDIIGSASIDKLNSEIDKITDASTLTQLKNAVERVINLYDELIERQRTSIQLTKMGNKYENKLDDIGYKAQNSLADQENIAKVTAQMAKIQSMVNEFKQQGKTLNPNQQNSLDKEVKTLNRLLKEAKALETEEDAIISKTIQLEEKFESISYRASRGLNKNIKELNQVKEMIAEIQKEMKGLDGLKGDAFTNKYKEIEKSMVDLSRKSRELRDNAREAENSFFGRFSHAMSQVPVWISAMTLFYGSMAQIRQGFESLVEIDSAMINLQKVTEATSEEMENFKRTASEIGFNLGVTTSEVISATTEFQKLGYSIQQSSALAKNSILYANVGDMDVESATQSIVSAVKGFDIAIDDSGKSVQKLVDIFNEVSNNYAISSEGIGQALQRSSAVLKQAGNSIEQSVALVTSANTTIQDPMKVGNALKTISMRLRGIGEDAEDSTKLVAELDGAFKSVSDGQMTIMKDENTFKSTYEIMDMLAQRWDSLTDAQQAYMTELIGGKEQGAIVASMMQNWSDAMGSYETALNSAGSAQREFQAYTESFEYKINQLKVSIEEFWMTLIDDEFAKSFIDFLTDAVQLITKLVDLLGSEVLVANFAGLFAILGSSTLRDTIFSDGKFVDNVKNTGKTVGGLVSQFAFLAKRLIPVIGLISALTLGTSLVIDFINKESNARKEKIATLEDEIKKYETLKETMDNTNLKEYLALEDRINSGQDLSTDEYARYKEIQGQIINQMPELVTYYDEHGNAVLRSADAIRKLVAQQEEAYAKNNELLVNTKIEEADFSDLQNEVDKINNMIKHSSSISNEIETFSFVEGWINKNKEALEKGGEELDSTLQEFFNEFNERIKNNPNKVDIQNLFFDQVGQRLRNGDIDKALSFIDSYASQLENKTMKVNDEINTAKANISDKMGEFSVLLEDTVNNYMMKKGIKTDSNKALFIQQLKEKIEEDIEDFGENDVKDILEELPEYFDEVFKTLEKANIDISELFIVDEKSTQEGIKKVFDEAISAIEKMDLSNGEKLVEVLKELENIKLGELKNATKDLDNLNQAVSDVAKSFDEAKDDIAFINGKLEEYTEHNKLSADSMMDIIGRFPTLIGYMNDEAGMIEQLKKLRKEDVDFAKRALAEKLQANEQFYQQNLKALQQFVNQQFGFYEGDLKQWKNLAQAKADVETQLINSLAKQWGVYYNKVLDSFSVYQSASKWTQSTNSFGIDLGQANKALEAQKELISFRDKWEGFTLDRITIDVGSIGTSLEKPKKEKKEKEKSLQDAIYVSDEYAKAIDRINTALAILQSRQERMSKGSNAYKASLLEEMRLNKEKKKTIDNEIKSLEKQIKTKKLQQTGLISIDKEDNRTARAKQAELQQKLDEAKKELNALKIESEEINNTIKDLSFSVIDASVEIFRNKRDSLSDDIAHAEMLMDLYSETSDEYAKHAEEKMNYLKQLEQYHKEELDYLEEEKKTNKDLTDAQREELNALIREAREGFYSASQSVIDFQRQLDNINVDKAIRQFEKMTKAYENAIDDINNKIKFDIEDGDYGGLIDSYKQILALTKGQITNANSNIDVLNKLKEKYKDNHEVVKKITDEVEKWQDAIRDAKVESRNLEKEIKQVYSDLADELVDLYKKQLELMQEAEEEHYNEQMDLQRKAHEKRMKQLDDELEAIRKIYNDRLKLIDREESTRTYNNDIEKMRTEAKELQRQIDILSMDDSYEAKAKKSELIKKLSELNLQISERQHEREIELRKDNLEDDLEAQEEALESQKDKYEEEYEAFVENEEKKKKARDKYWQAQLNDEKKFAQLREEVMSGNFDNLLTILQGWVDEVGREMGVLGEDITVNFTSKIQKAIEKLTELKNFKIGSFTDSINIGENVLPDDFNYDDIIGKQKGNSNRTTQLNEQDYKLLAGKFLTDELTKYATYDAQKNSLREKAHALGNSARANGATLDPNKNQGYSDIVSQLSNEEKIIFAKYMREYVRNTIQTPELKNVINDITDSLTSSARSSIGDDSFWYSDSFVQALNKYLQGFSSGGYTGKIKGGSAIAKVHDEELILDKQNTKTIKDFLGTDNIGARIKEVLNIDNVTQTIKDSIKGAFSYFKVPNVETASDGQIVTNTENYNITVNVERFTGNRKEVEIISEQLINDIKRKKGGRV